MSSRAVIGRSAGSAWKGRVGGDAAPEPWAFGEALLSRVIRYRGDLDALVDDLFADAPKAWDRLASPGGRVGPKDLGADDWLYLLDPAARTLRVLDGAGALFVEVRFNERGRADPASIERPASAWASIPEARGWDGAAWLPELDQVGAQVPPDPAVGDAVAELLPDDAELRVIWPRVPDAAYWRVQLGSQSLLYPTQAWRQATGWAQRSPNALPLWRPPHGEQVLSMTPAQVCEEVGLDRWAYELIRATWFARGGQGELVYGDQALPLRRWQVVTQVRDSQRELAAKGKKRKAGDVQTRAVDCPGWQWQLLDWLRWGQLGGQAPPG